jgi:pyridoxal phosphate enzyme (YggS family)
MTHGSRRNQIEAGLVAVQERIDRAREACGRVEPVRLVVVTKTFPASDVEILAGLGVTDVAENRDQEARQKRADCTAGALRWHMIGQVQRNKANSVVGWADVVESVDRVELVVALGRAAAAAGRTVQVLVQVSLDPVFRPGRGGADPADLWDLAARIDDDPGLDLAGLMGVAPYPGDTDEAFGRLRVLADQLRSRWPAAGIVSAGMSSDLEKAVAHGATQVRIGGAVLGGRSYVQ